MMKETKSYRKQLLHVIAAKGGSKGDTESFTISYTLSFTTV